MKQASDQIDGVCELLRQNGWCSTAYIEIRKLKTGSVIEMDLPPYCLEISSCLFMLQFHSMKGTERTERFAERNMNIQEIPFSNLRLGLHSWRGLELHVPAVSPAQVV